MTFIELITDILDEKYLEKKIMDFRNNPFVIRYIFVEENCDGLLISFESHLPIEWKSQTPIQNSDGSYQNISIRYTSPDGYQSLDCHGYKEMPEILI